MRIRSLFCTMVFGGLMFSFPLAADNCDECRESKGCDDDTCRGHHHCQCSQGSKRPVFNPLCRYYPYNSIYQYSYVCQDYDDSFPAWPSRRDGELSDSLSRY